jgi:hypothetical protein
MRSYRRPAAVAVAMGTVGVLLMAAPAGASARTVRCVGTPNSCGATVSIAGGAMSRQVTVKLTRSNLRLVRVAVIPGAARRSISLSGASYRSHGSRYRITVHSAKAQRRGARVVLIFAAGDPPGPGPGLKVNPPGTARSGTAIFSVGAGMTVSIVGGGSGTSNCTNDETNTTFVTKGNNEAHPFGFDSRGSGSCFYDRSWSFFKVSVKDPGGKQIASGTMWLGQNETFGGYYANCRDWSGFSWQGAVCSDNHSQTVTIERVG